MIDTSDVEYFPTAIVGAGCAGLTLAHELINSKDFPCILLDPQKFRPEHAFSFWDDGHPHLTLARSLARKTWSKWEIRTFEETIQKSSSRFVYSTVSSSNYENYLFKKIIENRGKILYAKATDLYNTETCIRLETSSRNAVFANRVFDSRPPTPTNKTIFQHFLGWEIKTNKSVFDETLVTLMDFRVPQEDGFHFMYVLPYSETCALIESTVYSDTMLNPQWYENQITKYLTNVIQCTSWDVVNKEQGAIPLNYKKDLKPLGTPIGLNAGAMRASTGYAFSQIIHQAINVGKQLKQGQNLIQIKPGATRFENWMDNVFLDVLSSSPKLAPYVFSTLAKTLSGDDFVKFMIGDCPLSIKSRIILALPKVDFMLGALRSPFK